MSIVKFDGMYRFLSNFYACKVTYQGVEYPSAEHAYQAAKSEDQSYREKIRNCGSPATAKRLGGAVQLPPNWEEKKLNVMYTVLLSKFSDPKLRQRLIDTGIVFIAEGNYWHDNFWGACKCKKCAGKGKNNLGMILMKIRANIKHAGGEKSLCVRQDKDRLSIVYNQKARRSI